MQLFFCERCGKRITDQDIQSGAARNKKLKGVYCSGCSEGVRTLALLPIDDAEAHRILANEKDQAPVRESPSRIKPARHKFAERGSQAAALQPQGRKGWLWATAGLGICLVGLGAWFAAPGSTPQDEKAVARDQKSPESDGVVPPHLRPPVHTPSTATSEPAQAPVQPAAPPVPVSPPPEPTAATREKIAQAAFEKAERELAAVKQPEAIRAGWEDFLKTYGDTVVAARARVLLASLQDAEPVSPQEVKQPEASPPPPHASPPAVGPQAEGPATPAGEWKTLSEVQFTGPDLDPFWVQEGTGPAQFANGAWRVDTSRQVRGAALVSAQEYALENTTYRLTVRCGYEGDAPKQRLSVGCVRARNAQYLETGRQSLANCVDVAFSAGEVSLIREHRNRKWGKEILAGPQPKAIGEYLVCLEIDLTDLAVWIDGVEFFKGPHDLKRTEKILFQLIGNTDTFPAGKEVWFRSAKVESRPK